jgi:RNA polymerase sigma-70 factor, ECF subfamily
LGEEVRVEEPQAIERLQRGDIGGLEFLVRQYQVRAVRTAYLVTHDVALAQDVVQAAFSTAYERIGRFDPQRPFGAWFFTTVPHAAIKAARERDRHLSFEGFVEDDTGRGANPLEDARPGPEALGEQAETAEEIWTALKRVSPDQRAAVVARYFLGLSEAETAAALALPLSTVKWRLYAARQRLRLLLHGIATQ